MKKIISLMVLLLVSTLQAQLNFEKCLKVPTGSSFEFVASGDIDGDGFTDIVGATTGSGDKADYSLFVWFSSSKNWDKPINIPYGGSEKNNAVSIAIGNFDNKFGFEVVLLTERQLQIYKYENNTLSKMFSFIVSGAKGLAIGDLDHDGKSDIALSYTEFNNVSVLYRDNNDFSFSLRSYPMEKNQKTIIGSFGTNIKESLISAGNTAVEIINFDENRNFSDSKKVSIPSGREIKGLALSDLFGDGENRLVSIFSSNKEERTIFSILFNREWQDRFLHPKGETLITGDLDKIPGTEILALHAGEEVLSVLDKNQTTLKIKIPYARKYTDTGICIGDFDADGNPDIAIADYLNGLLVLLNKK